MIPTVKVGGQKANEHYNFVNRANHFDGVLYFECYFNCVGQYKRLLGEFP